MADPQNLQAAVRPHLLLAFVSVHVLLNASCDNVLYLLLEGPRHQGGGVPAL
jgi:hypothetical protein